MPLRHLAVCLLAVALRPVVAADLAAALDLARCTVQPAGTVTADGPAVRITARLANPSGMVLLRFRQPLPTTGQDRLQLEGRWTESTGLGGCLSRLVLIDDTGRDVTKYEPDVWLPPEWNLRTVLLNEFEQPVPPRVGGLQIHLWAPREAGRITTLWLRRAELWSRQDVAAAVAWRPTAGRPVPAAAPLAARRWTSFGPGGGGWYRTVALSPHDGTLLVGADVGGLYRSRDTGRTWEMVNTGLLNTYVNALAFHPTDPRRIYAGSNGGVLRSTDGGDTWTPLRRGFPPLLTFGQSAPVSALLCDATRPQRVWAGVGHERDYGRLADSTRGGRVYRSVDGGETWTAAELPAPDAAKLSVLSLVQHPRRPDQLWATTQHGVFQSADGGTTWTRLAALDGYTTTFLTVRPDAPDRLLLAYAAGPAKRGGVLRSTDGGRTWTESNQGLPAQPDAWRLVRDPHDPATVLVGWHRRSGIFVSHDDGTTWRPFNAGPQRSAWFFEGENATGLAIDPRDPRRVVYCNDMKILQTLDGGQTWSQICTDEVQPATADQPARWRGRGCEVLCAGGPQALAVDPSRPQTLYFGYWDTCGWKSDDGGRSCYRLTNGLHSGYGRLGAVVLDPANSDTVWLSLGENYDRQRIYKSVDAGGVFHLVGHAGTGLPPGGVFSLVVDPASPPAARRLYAAVTNHGVYRSDDGGLTWAAKVEGLPADSRNTLQVALDARRPHRVVLIAAAHNQPATHTRRPGYLARSDDDGEHWTVVKDKIEPQCLVLDPFDPDTIYVGNRNFSGVDYPNAFYRSTDAGRTWQVLDQRPFLRGPGALDGDQGQRVYLASLVADPLVRGRLYCGVTAESYDLDNGRGVFVSNDGGRTWAPFELAGLANYRVATLVIDPSRAGGLYAGTGGNGFFRFGP